MSDYEVTQLFDPSHKDMADILNLYTGIPNRTCTAAAYLDYLNTNWLLVALFIVRKKGKIIGFTQAEAPNQLESKCAWLPFSHGLNECPHKIKKKAFDLAIKWMKNFGATKFKVTTVRNVKALERGWGMKRSKEVLMEKEI